MMAIALLGFADALYLTIAHYTHFSVPCTIVSGCDVVTKSAYSAVFGVPVALVGTAHYLVFFFVSLAFLGGAVHLRRWLRVQSALAVAASAYFVFLQAFVLKAYCFYCLTSALFSTLLFILAWWCIAGTKRNAHPVEEGELLP